MEKLDLTQKYKSYFKAANRPEIVDIGPAQYISIMGQGEPGGAVYTENLQALYSVAYALKFRFKDAGKDFVVSKLEGLWWFDTEKYKDIPMAETPGRVPREEWYYRLLIRLPDFVSEADVASVIEAVLAKKPLTAAGAVSFYTMHEGKCVQMLHVGPFEKEPESLALIMAFSEKEGLVQNGLHHEIYLSDFRKSTPDKYKTILREPVR